MRYREGGRDVKNGKRKKERESETRRKEGKERYKEKEGVVGREREIQRNRGERVLSQSLDRQTLDKTNPRQQKY